MDNKSEIIMKNRSIVGKIISWIFGFSVMVAGLINIFWGNDPEFGVFIFLLSFIYLFPVNTILRKTLGFTIPGIAKIVLGFLIIWVILGVGELFDKVDLMLQDLY